MINRQEIDGITWVDLESPSTEELREVQDEFDINPFIISELTAPTLKPSVVTAENYIYLILHFPVERHSHTLETAQEIDFILGKNFIITGRYDVVDPVHKLHKILETEAIIDEEPPFEHTGELFYRIVMKMYAGVLHELEYQDTRITDIEKEMFAGREKEMVFEISKVSTVLRNFASIINTHTSVLESFANSAHECFAKDFSLYSKALLGEQLRVKTTIENYLSQTSELRETNNSLLSTKQNEIMKTLTVMAFVAFPLSVVASIFGMNTVDMPIIGMPHDFWIVVGIMVAMTLAFFMYFLAKRWL